MSPLVILSLVLIGYLIGSVPVAYLVARSRGVDILSVGTGNPGAANTFRHVGRGAGVFVFLADILRGAAAVLVARALGAEPPELQIATGAAAVLGHWYPVFLRFRGGAGLAPLIGVALGVLPVAGLIALVPAILLLPLIRSTGHTAGIGFTIFLFAGVAMGDYLATVAVVALAAAVLIYSRVMGNRRGGH